MSSATIDVPAGFSLLGGYPVKNQDFAASIVFIALFALLIPLAFWRLARKETRHTILIRPIVVLLIRIATYVVRAIIANGNVDESLFITDQVLLLLGLLPLASTLVHLLGHHMTRNWVPTPEEPNRKAGLSRFLKLLELVLIVAIILGIVSASQTSDAMTDPAKSNSLKEYRYVTVGLTLAVVVLVPVLAAYETFQEALPLTPCLFLVGTAGLLVLALLYRLITTLRAPSLLSTGAKAAFYVLSALPEWICLVALLAFNLEHLFSVQEGSWKAKVAKKMKKGKWTGPYVNRDELEMGRTRVGSHDAEYKA